MLCEILDEKKTNFKINIDLSAVACDPIDLVPISRIAEKRGENGETKKKASKHCSNSTSNLSCTFDILLASRIRNVE